MSTEILSEAERKMARAVEAMERDFQALRTGRASTSLVERLHVDYYGTQTPLNQLASISVPEAHQIVIQPWDRGVLGAIEKAIMKSDIGHHAQRRRDGRPAQHPAAHRGASQGHRAKRPQADGGGPRRGAQRAPRGERLAQEGGAGRRPRRPTRPAARSTSSRRSPTGWSRTWIASARPRSRRSWRSSGPGAARSFARAAYRRPAPRARRGRAGGDRRPSRRPPRRRCCRRRTCPGTSRSSWTATAAGPAPGTCPTSTATRPGSKRCAASSSTRSGAASRC